MGDSFERMLIDVIPFQKSDSQFARFQRIVDNLLAKGVKDVEEMEKTLNDNNFDVSLRETIPVFLSWLKYKPAIKSLAQIATSQSSEISLRRSAIVNLSILGRSRAFSILKRIILSDSSPYIRLVAIRAFTVAPNKRAFGFLTRLMFEAADSDVRAEAIRAIGSIPQGDKDLTFELLTKKFLDLNEDGIVRAYAMEGLGFLRDRRALDMIVANLTNPITAIRYMAAYALGEVGNSGHFDLIETMFDDHSFFEGWGTVSEAAKKAMEIIHNRNFCPV